MKKNVNKVKCDIQSHIIAAGYTQKEAVDACAAEFDNWSPSDSNFSNKLDKQTLHTGKCCSWRRFLVMRSSGSAGEMNKKHTKSMKMEDNAYE